jgi:putative transposase
MLFLIARQRAAIAHQLSNYLTKTFDRIVIEDLNVKGMIKNRKLSRVIADVGFGMLRHFIEYKAKLRKCIVVIADRFFPSSKTTSTLMLRLTIRCHHHRHHRPLNHTPLFWQEEVGRD